MRVRSMHTTTRGPFVALALDRALFKKTLIILLALVMVMVQVPVHAIATERAEAGISQASSVAEAAGEASGANAAAAGQEFGPAGTETFESILGEAVNYGVTTGAFTLLQGDAQTNVAAREGVCVNQTGSDLTNDVEQTFVLASIPSVFNIKGYGAYVMTTEADAGRVRNVGADYLVIDTSKTREELEARVDGMLAHASAQSAALAAREPNARIEYDSATQRHVLDVRGRGAGAYYADVDEATYQGIQQAGKLQIHKDDDQTVVFNFRQGGDVTIQKFDVNGKGADAFLDRDAGSMPGTLVFNFPNAESVTNWGSITGIVLAPLATFNVEATSSGWLVSDEVVIGAGEWHNVYQHVEKISQGSSVPFGARKTVDGAPAEVSGFGFELAERVGDEWAVVREAESAGDSVSFGEITYDENSFTSVTDNQTYLYRIRETRGTSDSDGASYEPDASVYYARVSVSKVTVAEGGVQRTRYVASGPDYYADEACTQRIEGGPVFDNRLNDDGPFEARASIEADKTYFGPGEGARFDFLLTASDAEGNARSGAGIEHEGVETLVDEGQQFSVSATNDALSGGNAPIALPELVYRRPGDYHYVLSEVQGADDAGGASVVSDDSRFLIRVSVGEDGGTSVAAQLLGVDDAPRPDRDIGFYNNGLVSLGYAGLTVAGAAEPERRVSLAPEVGKVLRNGTLRSGQFAFDLLDSEGRLLERVANDATGRVAFGRIAFSEAGEYDFAIVENPSGSPAADDHIVYSDEIIGLHVSVVENPNGALVATKSWTKNGVPLELDGAGASDALPTITNEVVSAEVRVQKRSREAPYEPLGGARYGLWMESPSGMDVYMGSDVSGEDGYLSFELPLEEDTTYYFKEESAPDGHLVNPYRSAGFTLAHGEGQYWLAYEDGTESVATEPQDARVVLEYTDPTGGPGGVSDEPTRLNVAKLEADSSEYVVGAHLAIFTQEDYDAGDLSNPVEEWRTDESTHQISKNGRLNASAAGEQEAQRYVLVELAAPEGYEKADPVTFCLASDGGEETTVLVISGKTKADGTKNCEVTSKFTLALYDGETTTEREIVSVRTRGAEEATGASGVPSAALAPPTRGALAQTGDIAAIAVAAAISALGLAAIFLGGHARHRGRGDGR